MEEKCQACELLGELYQATEKTARLYWVMTELFVLLHNGKDYCNSANEIKSKFPVISKSMERQLRIQEYYDILRTVII